MPTSARSTRAPPARASSSSTSAATDLHRAKEHRQIYPKPGWVEHDPLEILGNTFEVIGAALARANLTAGDLASRRHHQPARNDLALGQGAPASLYQRAGLAGYAHRPAGARYMQRRRPGPFPRENRPAARHLFLRPEAPLDAGQYSEARAKKPNRRGTVRHHRYLAGLEPNRRTGRRTVTDVTNASRTS